MNAPDPISAILLYKEMKDIWQAKPDDTVLDAIKLMSEKNVGALLVMDGDRLAGIVSERDYTRKVILRGRYSKDTRVSAIMTNPVVCVAPGTRVDVCMQLMSKKRIRHLPVIEADNHICGIVSMGDIVKWIISAQEALIDQLESYVIGNYPD